VLPKNCKENVVMYSVFQCDETKDIWFSLTNNFNMHLQN
jgi:hypothetical protein